jgi:hypothetical protein
LREKKKVKKIKIKEKALQIERFEKKRKVKKRKRNDKALLIEMFERKKESKENKDKLESSSD